MHCGRKFWIGTFDHGATIFPLNFQLVMREVICQVSGTIVVVPWSKVPNWNFWPWCDYFYSKLAISDAWRVGNPSGFQNHFSSATFKSSNMKLLTVMRLLTELLYRIYTFVLAPRLATCTNIHMPLCEWTVFTCVRIFTCSYTLMGINCSHHSSPLTRVRKPVRERAPRMARRMTQRMTRQICDWYTRRSPCYSPHQSSEFVNAVLIESSNSSHMGLFASMSKHLQ